MSLTIDKLETFGHFTNLPKLSCLHLTENLDIAKRIASNGFDLSKFGATAKRFNAPESLHKNDPKAVFALPYESELKESQLPHQAFVHFRLPNMTNVWLYDNPPEGHSTIKSWLFEQCQPDNANDFAKQLIKLGVGAICPADFSSEIIILKPDAIMLGVGHNSEYHRLVNRKPSSSAKMKLGH